MLRQALPTFWSEKIERDKIELKEPLEQEVIDEVSEGVESFLTLITLCEGSFWLVVTMTLLFTIPLLSPVGIVLITRLIFNYKKKLRELRDDSTD